MLVPGGGCLQKETEGGSAVWELVARRVGGWSIQMLDRFSQLQIDEILDLRFSSKTLSFFASFPSLLPSFLAKRTPESSWREAASSAAHLPKGKGTNLVRPKCPGGVSRAGALSNFLHGDRE